MQPGTMHSYGLQGARVVGGAGTAVVSSSTAQASSMYASVSGLDSGQGYRVSSAVQHSSGGGGFVDDGITADADRQFWFDAVRQIEEAVDQKVQNALQEIITFAATCTDQFGGRLAEERYAREQTLSEVQRLLEEQNVKTVDIAQKTATASFMTFEEVATSSATAACQLEAELAQMRSFFESARETAQRDSAHFREAADELKESHQREIAAMQQEMQAHLPNKQQIDLQAAAAVEAAIEPLKLEIAAQHGQLQDLDALRQELAGTGDALKEQLDRTQEYVQKMVQDVNDAQIEALGQLQGRVEVLETRGNDTFRSQPPEIAPEEVASMRLLLESVRGDFYDLRARVDQDLTDLSTRLSGERVVAREDNLKAVQLSEHLAGQLQALRRDVDKTTNATSTAISIQESPDQPQEVDCGEAVDGNGAVWSPVDVVLSGRDAAHSLSPPNVGVMGTDVGSRQCQEPVVSSSLSATQGLLSSAIFAAAPSSTPSYSSSAGGAGFADQRGIRKDGCSGQAPSHSSTATFFSQAVRSVSGPSATSLKVRPHISMPSASSSTSAQVSTDQLNASMALSGSSSKSAGMSVAAPWTQVQGATGPCGSQQQSASHSMGSSSANANLWSYHGRSSTPMEARQLQGAPLTQYGNCASLSSAAPRQATPVPLSQAQAQAKSNFMQMQMGGIGGGMLMMHSNQTRLQGLQGQSPQRARGAISTSPVRSVAPVAAPYSSQQAVPEWAHAGTRSGRVASPRRDLLHRDPAPVVRSMPRSISPSPIMGPAAAAAAAEAAALAALRRA